MKKVVNVIGILLVVILLLCLPSCGTPKDDEMEFFSNGDGTCYIANSNSNISGNVIIPEISPTGDVVTSIGERAFYNCSGMTSVTIPDSVTSIGERAFYNCSGLTSVTIGNSVTSIGGEAFYNCSGLTSITIPSSVKSIGDDAFYGCSGLTSITIPDSVTSIDSRAFSGCSGLTSITIPNSVTSIGDDAFSGCSGLTSITIPDSVTSIGSYAFSGCSNLESITLPFVGDTKDGTGNMCFDYIFGSVPSSLKTVVITGGTSIRECAFYGCSGLASITIPDSVTSIGDSAFSGCSGLTTVTIGKSVESIGELAFYGCSGLKEVHISDIAAWCKISFSYNSILCSVSNPLYYAENLYLNDTLVTELVIPDSMTSIGDYAFSGCSGLSVTIPDSVTNIGKNAFLGCSGLSATIGNSVKSIGRTFYGCSDLISITVKEGNTKYHSKDNCLIETASKTLILGCQNSVIPTDGSVTSIGSYAFEDCSGLTSITIPDSVTSIGGSAFSGCSGLTSITVGKGNKKYHSRDNCLIETASKTLILGCKASIIPTDGSVTSIGYEAFSGCSGLTSVTIPDSVTEIGERAFGYCSGLTSVTIGNGVTYIEKYAFSGCSGLTSVTIGNGVTSIARAAFYNCSKLTNVTFNDTTTWYRTLNFFDWGSNGLQISVTDPSTNARLFRNSDCYWYKK